MPPSEDDDWEEDNLSGGDNSSDWSEDEDENDSDRTLLWLCQEGALDCALEKVRGWDRDHPSRGNNARVVDTEEDDNSEDDAIDDDDDVYDTIHRELFQTNSDRNHALHEVLMGGTTDGCASELVRRILMRCTADYPNESIIMCAATPPSHCRTLLHWCAWGKESDVQILKLLVTTYPEALCIKDNPRPRGQRFSRRTPLELAERYWPNADMTGLLKKWTMSYLPYRVRLAVHLCAHRHFCTNNLTPFHKADRKRVGLTPRPWFVASVIGYALQREMVGLALHILSFVGKRAKIDNNGERKKTNKKKRQRTTSST